MPSTPEIVQKTRRASIFVQYDLARPGNLVLQQTSEYNRCYLNTLNGSGGETGRDAGGAEMTGFEEPAGEVSSNRLSLSLLFPGCN